MTPSETHIEADLEAAMITVGHQAQSAARVLSSQSPDMIKKALHDIAAALRAHQDEVLTANNKDLMAAEDRGLSPAMVDRLRLTPDRLDSIAASVDAIADQTSPLGQILDEWTQPNGLHFRKVTVPIGVIGMIYESRPNVTTDAAALCLKSGNAVILRGGSEAVHSNRALFSLIQRCLKESPVPHHAVQLIMTQDREAVGHLLRGLDQSVDLIIPRGGKGLVERVQSDARVPVLAHLDGLNHSYVHQDADPEMATAMLLNAKMRRTGICGATETALVDERIAATLIPGLVDGLSDLGCEIRGDSKSQALDARINPATAEDFKTEHLAPILNLAIVSGLDEALQHIATHGSGHTDAIVTENTTIAQRFLDKVDSAIVLHNASTQFADGGEFGFGAEIGIATGRLHARGPVGAQHLTSYKYQVVGQGTLRP